MKDKGIPDTQVPAQRRGNFPPVVSFRYESNYTIGRSASKRFDTLRLSRRFLSPDSELFLSDSLFALRAREKLSAGNSALFVTESNSVR